MNGWMNTLPEILDPNERKCDAYRLGCRQLAAWHRTCELKKRRDAARKAKIARRTFEAEVAV